MRRRTPPKAISRSRDVRFHASAAKATLDRAPEPSRAGDGFPTQVNGEDWLDRLAVHFPARLKPHANRPVQRRFPSFQFGPEAPREKSVIQRVFQPLLLVWLISLLS